MKKLISVILAAIMLVAFAVSPMSAAAIITTYNGMVSVLPGNTRSSSPDYNYAWLDNVIIRDDAMAVTSTAIVPKPDDYQGSHTYDEFIKEAEQYSVLFGLDENTVANAYKELTYTMYYLAVAMGMTDELPVMRQYLMDYGIKLPNGEDADDKAAIAVVYAALKYDAVYVLYEKHAAIPVGTTLEGALVIIISALTNTMLPSGINTFTGMAVNMVKTYVTQFEQLPVSENPDAEEVFHWAKVITAASNEYQVPLASFDMATEAQKDYVDYAYYATIINTVYDVKLNPIHLVIATQSDDELALQKLILHTMLNEREISFDKEASAEELFNLASANGCFALEDEFYSDILTYELKVAQNCEKIWFTPFALADQLDGGSNENISIDLNGALTKPSATVGVSLDTTAAQEEILMSVAYNDAARNDSAVYKFIVVKDPSLNTEGSSDAENNLVADVQDFVDTIVPADNEKVSEIVDNIFAGVDGQLSQTGEGESTTFSVGGSADTQISGVTVYTTDGYDFQYLDDLFAGVYATDADGNIITTTSFLPVLSEAAEKPVSFIQTVTDAVKENPEIIIAPTSLLTLGSLAGFLFTKKQRKSVLDSEDEQLEEDGE